MKEELVPFADYADKFLKKPEVSYILSTKSRDDVDNGLKFIDRYYNALDEGKEFILTEEEIKNTVQRVADLIHAILREHSIDKDLREFILSLLHVLATWNRDAWRNSSFSSRLQFLERYVKNSLTLSENVDALNRAIGRLQRARTARPEPFELSAHYFQLLEE